MKSGWKKRAVIFIGLALMMVLCACGENKKSPGSADSAENTDKKENRNEEVAHGSVRNGIETAANSGISSVKIQFPTDLSFLSGYSTESLPWGPGYDTDEYNRPIYAVNFQERYGQYNAEFIKENSNTIYLTMDEGYENGYTAQILDVLKEKQVTAVFFVTMDYVTSEPELVQRMIDEGHIVGGHSLTHPDDGLPSLSLSEQLQEVKQVHEYVEENFGYTMYLFRYPAGIFSEQSLALVQSCGYHSIFWSFAYQDWLVNDQPDPTEALDTIMSRIHPGAIYLLHAVSATNTQILGDFIDRARAEGYIFGVYTVE